ncbi:unnamed protein product [Cylindrotheca closterium]|uniref:Carrier domain-containing protein n=1 Tax=Cylindrotheca closterium TaxID=2856 RepID=A0AAD2G486_9STRA|nr:unnamed protein product [Cylindrotheca closterium]
MLRDSGRIQRNDQTKGRHHLPDLVREGQAEAKRLEQEAIPKLHEGLKPLGKEVLKIGLQVKEALSEVRELKANYWEKYEEECQLAAIFFEEAMNRLERHLKSGQPYPKGTITTEFTRYQQVARQHDEIEAKVDASDIAQTLDTLMESKYSAAVLALDEKAHELDTQRAPWELRYFATSEMDESTGKMTLSVSIGGDDNRKHSNDNSYSSTLDDQCRLCHQTIPANQNRVRSFESSLRTAVMCSECYKMTCRAESIVDDAFPLFLTTTDGHNDTNFLDVAKQELLHIWPYCDHMLVTEHDSPFGLRRQAMGLAEHKTPKEKKKSNPTTLRTLLPRFLDRAYRNRPLFGVPQEDSAASNNDHSSHGNVNSQQFHLTKIPYQWFTYQQVWQVVCTLANGMIPVLLPIQKLLSLPQEGDSSGQSALSNSLLLRPEVGILSSASPIFFAMQMACISLGRISVAMDTSWKANDVWRALDNAKVSTLLLDPQGFQMLMTDDATAHRLPACIQKVIVIASDPFQPNKDIGNIGQAFQCYKGEKASLEMLMADASEWWKEESTKFAIQTVESFSSKNKALPTDEYLFGLFSSGTSGSGDHKGVLVWESAFRESNATANFDHPVVGCLKSSPSWASGNDIVWQTMLAGGRIGFAAAAAAAARSKALSLSIWNHLYSIKPTWRLSFVPAMVTDLMEEYSQAFEFFRQYNAHPSDDDNTIEKRQHWARAKAAEYLYSCLGGSIEVISVGGAMVNQSHIEFLSRVLPCEIYQGYGSTEGGGIAIANHNDDRLIPHHRMKFRVESRPVLGYTMDDKPFPRGELLILGKETARMGDWFGEDETVQDQRKKYSDDGYYCTGDIVEYHPDANSFRIIDRVSSLVKLPDGIFFSPHRVETSIGDLTPYGISGFIVTSTLQGTVALVLESFQQAADDGNVLLEVQRRCRESNIDERCIPRQLIADEGGDQYPDDSSNERLWKTTGCYTVSGKLIRQRVYDRVKDLLIEADKMNDVGPIASSIGAVNKEKETALALIDAIGIPRGSQDDAEDITSLPLEILGVNSLLWVKLRSFVRQSLAQRGHSGTKLPFFNLSEKNMMDVAGWMTDVIVSQPSAGLGSVPVASEVAMEATDLRTPQEDPSSQVKNSNRTIAREKATTKDGKQEPPIPMSSHSVNMNGEELSKRAEFKQHAHNIDKLESELFRLVDAEIPLSFERCQYAESTCSSELQRIFLTGATGFLGRHVLRSLLMRGAEVTCLVRGKSDEDARSRVISVLSSIGMNEEPLLARLNILTGNISLEKFGLEQQVYDMLACNTDAIVHAAAQVKMWSLDTAFGDAHEMLYTNTQSCVSISRLSACAKQIGRQTIPVVYTSTKSVENGLSEGTSVGEAGLYYSSSTMRQQPYTISKLLGETALMYGSRKHQGSLCIMRPPLLTFSSGGDSNDSDWFVRLLLTVMDLGLAPSHGQSEFLSKQTVFEPVDEYANKVVKEVFQQLEEQKLESTSDVKWADAYEEETKPKLRIRDILYHLEGDVEPVPAYAFRSAVLFSEHPLPFLPLAKSLVDRRDTRVENDFDESLPIAVENGQIPPLLQEGLLAFLKTRCPSITIKSIGD